MNDGKIVYEGNAVFRPINFGLYGYEVDMDFEETKDNILRAFVRDYSKAITSVLNKCGMEFVGLKWFSPREYNFTTDSLDLVAKVSDKMRVLEYIVRNRAKIQRLMDSNRSYDGFISTTESSVDDELLNLAVDYNYRPDLMVVAAMLEGAEDFKDFEIEEHFVINEEEMETV